MLKELQRENFELKLLIYELQNTNIMSQNSIINTSNSNKILKNKIYEINLETEEYEVKNIKIIFNYYSLKV